MMLKKQALIHFHLPKCAFELNVTFTSSRTTAKTGICPWVITSWYANQCSCAWVLASNEASEGYIVDPFSEKGIGSHLKNVVWAFPIKATCKMNWWCWVKMGPWGKIPILGQMLSRVVEDIGQRRSLIYVPEKKDHASYPWPGVIHWDLNSLSLVTIKSLIQFCIAHSPQRVPLLVHYQNWKPQTGRVSSKCNNNPSAQKQLHIHVKPIQFQPAT